MLGGGRAEREKMETWGLYQLAAAGHLSARPPHVIDHPAEPQHSLHASNSSQYYKVIDGMYLHCTETPFKMLDYPWYL
jgi:hypothetical protein